MEQRLLKLLTSIRRGLACSASCTVEAAKQLLADLEQQSAEEGPAAVRVLDASGLFQAGMIVKRGAHSVQLLLAGVTQGLREHQRVLGVLGAWRAALGVLGEVPADAGEASAAALRGLGEADGQLEAVTKAWRVRGWGGYAGVLGRVPLDAGKASAAALRGLGEADGHLEVVSKAWRVSGVGGIGAVGVSGTGWGGEMQWPVMQFSIQMVDLCYELNVFQGYD